jgi:hypothetical protein
MKIMASVKAVLLKPIGKNEAKSAVDRLLSAPILRNKLVFWILAFIFAWWLFLQSYSFFHEWDTDSPSYYAAAHGLLTKINIYEDAEFQVLGNALFGRGLIIYPYIYPPLLAQLLLPLAGLPLSTFVLIFNVLNFALIFLGLFLIARVLEFDLGRSILPPLFLFLLLPFNEPLQTTLHHGQVNLLVLDIILLSLIFQKKDRPVPAALFLSLAVFIKIYPVLFILPFIFSKKIRYLTAFGASSAALLAASVLVSGTKPWLDFARSTLDLFLKRPDSPFTRGFQDSFGNVSLKSFLSQLFAALRLPPSLVIPVFIALAVLFLFLMFGSPWKRAIASDLPLEGSLLLILTLVLAPITWSHHFVLILFPAAYLFNRILAEKRYAAFLLLAFLISQIFYNLPWGAFPFNQVRLAASLGFLAMLFYFAATSPRPVRASTPA